MPNRPTHLAVAESFTFAQRESLEFELAMSGTGTLRAVLLTVKPNGEPLAIITSTQTHALARLTRVDQRLVRLILHWPSWVESQAVLHLLCAPTDELDSFSRLNQLSLAHYGKPTSLHYQPEIQEYIGWRSLHLASWRIVEGQPQMKALAQPYDHALPAAADDFGFSAADVASALVLPHIKSRRSQHAGLAMQTALQETVLPLAAPRPMASTVPQDIDLTDASNGKAKNTVPHLPRVAPQPAGGAPTTLVIPALARTQADRELARSIAGLLQAWQQALPELPADTWEVWQQHWLFNHGAESENALSHASKNWRQELQTQPWLLELIRQHTTHMLSPLAKGKALGWLNHMMNTD